MDIPLTPKRSALSSLQRKLQSVQDRAMQTLHPVGANAPTSDPTAQTEAVKGQPQEPASRLQSRRIAHARRRPDSAPRVGTYSGRGGGGLRAVAGGLDACPSTGIWDRAVPRRPGLLAQPWLLGLDVYTTARSPETCGAQWLIRPGR